MVVLFSCEVEGGSDEFSRVFKILGLLQLGGLPMPVSFEKRRLDSSPLSLSLRERDKSLFDIFFSSVTIFSK